MTTLSKRKLQSLLLIGALLPTMAFATNGYFLIGYGSKSRSMGGAGVAYAQDAMAAAANPAGMAHAKVNTMQIDVGGEFFLPRRSAFHNSTDLPADHISGSNLFLIPNMGAIYKFNRKMYIGMAAIGAGSNTRYDQSPGNGNGQFFDFNQSSQLAAGNPRNATDTVGVNLLQMQMLPSIAYKLNKTHTVGASLAVAVQSFRAYGLGAFASNPVTGQGLGFSDDGSAVTNRGNDWSYGAGIRLGWLGNFFKERFSIGVNYASRVYMTRFRKYEGLFAEQGSFDIPEHYALGVALKATKKLTVAADVQRIRYSSVRSVGNPGPLVLDPPSNPGQLFPDGIGKLGEDNGLGFGWDDMTVYKVGINYQHSPKWSFRAGFNYGENPIPEDQILFALLAPATVEKHATVGFSYVPGKNHEWSVNVMHAFKNTVKGPTRFQGSLPPGEDNAAASMYQWSLGIGYAFKL